MRRLLLGSALVFLLSQVNAFAVTTWTASLAGGNEVPPTGSAGTGFAVIILNGDTLTVSLSFSGLTAPATAGHIHCCGPLGMNEPVALPFSGLPNATSGTYSNSFDLTSTTVYQSAFLTSSGGTAAGAEAALVAGLNSGQTYVNLHNVNNPGGEIRGQVSLSPEPATAGLGLLLLGVAGVAARLRSRAAQRLR